MKKVPWLKWAKNGDFRAFLKGAGAKENKKNAIQPSWVEL